jgi:pyruvate,water dikinase
MPTTDDHPTRSTTDWEAPGVGSWTSGADHVPTSVTRSFIEIYGPARNDGLATMFATYGLPAAGYDAGFVHGHLYDRLRPLIGGDKPNTKLPPAPILKLATRVHPEFRRRNKVMTRTFARTRGWEPELGAWHEHERDRWVADNLALQDVDVATLDDAAFVDHVRATAEHLRVGVTRHFTLKGVDSLPLGDLLALTAAHGIPAADVTAALRGASPTSGVPELLTALVDAVRAAGVRPSSMADLRAAGPAAAALDTYLRHFGWRIVTGYDVDGRCLIELPGVVVSSVVALLDRPSTTTGAMDAVAVGDLRQRVPPDVRPELDERFGHAVAVYGVRDENGPLVFQWPLGLFRRALLEAGARLQRSGRLHQADHALELSPDEVVALVRGGDQPTADEAASRAATRAADSRLEPPAQLGPDEPPPPAEVLPASLARGVLAINAFLSSMTGERTGRRAMAGVGIGSTPYSGRAVVADSAEEAVVRLEPGDVLVAQCTSPAYNAVLPIVGAVITEEGGPLSHAAVMARELGIAAIVGVPGATRSIADGDRITVDPAAGMVEITASGGATPSVV